MSYRHSGWDKLARPPTLIFTLIHLSCLVLDGVYRRDVDGTPEFVEAPEPTDEALQMVLHKIITRLMKRKRLGTPP